MCDKHYLSDNLEVESQSATNVTIQPLGLGLFEDTFENAQWRKVKQMQPSLPPDLHQGKNKKASHQTRLSSQSLLALLPLIY